jgi:ligand-binding sensor domain-containing protein
VYLQIFPKLILLARIYTAFYSCKGQDPNTNFANSLQYPLIPIGRTVSELGKDIGCILQDRNGIYWFASNGGGVFRYEGNMLKHITEQDGLCSNYVLGVQQDNHGNIWFSTREGVCNFNGATFTNYSEEIMNAPYATLKYTNGGIFFGHLNGICFFDGFTFKNFVIHPEDYQPSKSDLNRPYSMYSKLCDKDGNVWFGTQSKGVCRYDGKSFSYFSGHYLSGYAVRTMFQDSKGNLWFGNNGGGLFRYDGKTLVNITEEKGLENLEFLNGYYNDKPGSLARVWSINEDKEGNLWIGTIDAGVWKFDGKNLTNYTVKDGLGGNAIWNIFKNQAGELWFVVNGEAIYTFNGKTFLKYTFN